MGIFVVLYNSLFGTAKFGEDKFGKLEIESPTTNAFDKFLRKTFYKDNIDKSFIKNIRNTFYK